MMRHDFDNNVQFRNKVIKNIAKPIISTIKCTSRTSHDTKLNHLSFLYNFYTSSSGIVIIIKIWYNSEMLGTWNFAVLQKISNYFCPFSD